VTGRARKGVLLVGGRGSRLFPLTLAVNKHLLPVHDKPMVYYPLSTLMLAGVRDIAIVSSPEHLPAFEQLLGDGAQLGLAFSYVAQAAPRGIGDGLRAADSFLAGDGCLLALGDNLLWGPDAIPVELLDDAAGATVLAVPVRDPSRYGVVETDAVGRPTSVEEKPERPGSSLAIPGLYLLDGRAPELARLAVPSARGELEITDILRAYLGRDELRVALVGRDTTWLDMGTCDDIVEAAQLVAAAQARGGPSVGCIEEVAVRAGLVSRGQMRSTVSAYPPGAYRARVEAMLDG
jgi:glucose-1-phosphate thymidylyltransferase